MQMVKIRACPPSHLTLSQLLMWYVSLELLDQMHFGSNHRQHLCVRSLLYEAFVPLLSFDLCCKCKLQKCIRCNRQVEGFTGRNLLISFVRGMGYGLPTAVIEPSSNPHHGFSERDILGMMII